MVTDSWTHARGLVARRFAHTTTGGATVTGLDDARARLLSADTAQEEQTALDIALHLRRAVDSGDLTADELRALSTALEQLAAPPPAHPVTVHNEITGGTQHGPVIQSGRITGLSFGGREPWT
ncbi:hypothetical protein [Streptomyces avidinii]|uniref:DUF1707 domain-containing protein n=1 Tax=Streptomyces avidinii TaxID=1895 RepID=A0ABS4LHT6_STRAV|nr:hypothetical protein [Streptomyces avidinii]MBP2041520.1 hypothetical protein [Streptomyces avidinii]